MGQLIVDLQIADRGFHTVVGWMILGHIVTAFVFTLLCGRYVATGGAGAGATLGRTTFDLIRGSTVDR